MSDGHIQRGQWAELQATACRGRNQIVLCGCDINGCQYERQDNSSPGDYRASHV
jgi:hypothetical protein